MSERFGDGCLLFAIVGLVVCCALVPLVLTGLGVATFGIVSERVVPVILGLAVLVGVIVWWVLPRRR